MTLFRRQVMPEGMQLVKQIQLAVSARMQERMRLYWSTHDETNLDRYWQLDAAHRRVEEAIKECGREDTSWVEKMFGAAPQRER